MKLLAIDGNSILNRAYYGIRPLTAKDGTPTNAIYGFLNILLKMQHETGPDSIAIAFDVKSPTFRHKKYDGYKATRKGMPEDLAVQLPLLKELLGHLGYVIVEHEGWEADDILGTLAKSSRCQGAECVISTGDRDSFQLIGNGVTVRLASTKGGRPHSETYDTDAIMEKYGVTPPQLIDVKALMGDSSDNIPGVAGIGEKTALSLIQDHQTLDRIYSELAALSIKDAVRKKLIDGKDMAYLSRELAEIDCNTPIESDIAAYRKNPVDNAAAYRIMARLELFSLMEKFGVRPAINVEDTSISHQSKHIATDIRINQLPDAFADTRKPIDVLFAFDGYQVKAICIADEGTVYYLDRDLETAAREILCIPAPKRTNQIKSIYRYGLLRGFTPRNIIFDVEIAAYILNPTANDYRLGRLCAEYGVPEPDKDGIFGEHAGLIADMGAFSALADRLAAKIIENEQVQLLTDIELPLAEVLAAMEHEGIGIDLEGLRAYGERLESELKQVQARVYLLAGEKFNINSPKQLGVVLFDKLGLPAGKKTKTGYSTNADVLESLRGKHGVIDEILEFRKLSKLKSTYADGLTAVAGEDNRIHTTFQQTLTRTGRISSVEPNMQNIPVRTELGSELRRFFIADEDTILLDADYSQIELRVLAHIAGDETMIEAFRSEEDIHTRTASQVFNMPPDFVTPLMRNRAKAVNFGIVYGIGAFSLSQDIGVSISEADSYIKGYLSVYSGVRKYMDDIVKYGSEHGYVLTMFGRRRYLPELSSSNRNLREFGKRVALNTPIQGTAADIIKIAMVRVYHRLKKEGLRARLILQVHDELIVESPLDEADRASLILREEMERAAELSIPLVAEVGRGKNWLEAK